MRRILIAAGAMALAISVTAPSRAAAPYVSVYNGYFSPSPTQALAGETVTWTWGCSYGSCAGTHNVTAWEGATFASANQTYPATFTAVMSSAPIVRYRCTLHSTLTGSTCSGMCGVLSNDGGMPTGSVAQPAEGEVVFAPGTVVPVTFSGPASDDTALESATVRTYDLLGRAQDHPATLSPPKPAKTSTWSVTSSLSPGSYLAEVAVTDWVGNTYRSPRVRFHVL